MAKAEEGKSERLKNERVELQNAMKKFQDENKDRKDNFNAMIRDWIGTDRVDFHEIRSTLT